MLIFSFRVKHHLEPLALATNFTQASHCRLDDVLLVFAFLYKTYSQTLTDPVELGVREALLNSIEKRWMKSDQDVFIAALVLNPVYNGEPFSMHDALTAGNLLLLMRRLWKRFHHEEAPATLDLEVLQYLRREGKYASMNFLVGALRVDADAVRLTFSTIFECYLQLHQKGERFDPVKVWDHTAPAASMQAGPLLTLARRIFAICPNSAACERLFSLFGNLLTKLRSRLAMGTMVNLAELKMNVRDEVLREDSNAKKKVKKQTMTLRSRPDRMTRMGSSSTLPLQPSVSGSGNSSTLPASNTAAPEDLPASQDEGSGEGVTSAESNADSSNGTSHSVDFKHYFLLIIINFSICS